VEIRLEPILNRANAGLALAHQVLDALAWADAVTLDFSTVDRMTPSFANAFMMTILEALEDSRERVLLLHRNEQVIRVMEESARRFDCGLRQPAMA
jgi:hypothetical protein